MSKKERTWLIKSSNKDYLYILHVYIHKRILYVLLFLLFLLPVSLLLYEVYETYRLTTLSEQEKITYRYDDKRLNHIEGYVILINNENKIVYKGEFANGACNGLGTLYKDGKVRYIGKFLDNKYEDEKGQLFDVEGNVLYEGGFVKGVYEGEGFLYYSNGNYKAQGTFRNGELNGEGIEYREDGSVLREGTYLYGRLNGHGISYYEGSNIRRYEGQFVGNEAIGEGTLFSSSGRAWYVGQVYDYTPDYNSYIGATYKDVREHFLDPILIYTSENSSAICVPKQEVLFISSQSYVSHEEEINVEENTKEEKKESKEDTKEVAVENSVDESKLFIESVGLVHSYSLTQEDCIPYQEKVLDGVYQYQIDIETYEAKDLYCMMLLQELDGYSPLDVFFTKGIKKDEVQEVTLMNPFLEGTRYAIYYHGIRQSTMLFQEETWAYQIVEEREVMQ